MKILICDDDAKIIDVLKRFLKKKGARVDCALNGKVALEMVIHELSYDIIFLDVNMPGFTGIDILRYVRENHVKSKIVVLTGYPGVTRNFCELLGADEYLEKPVDLKVIGDIVDKYTTL
jgi:CheY-like chemotaxis protein